ncbi:MAG: LptA/OstA family protein [Desulfococcaceae bacterium]|jgi:lipopolysaccharide export system protein LptA|nr:LptA/OstA family protein [Desulfococcaceae bacterium]
MIFLSENLGSKVPGGFFLLISLILFSGIQGRAEEKKAASGNEKIRISAQSLEADDAEKYAEFSGNVRVVQGETLINSDRLKIFYAGNPIRGENAEKNAGKSGDSIEKIVASGNVRIRFDNMDALASEAVYTTADRVMVLHGPGAQIRKADSGEIKGDKIIIRRDDGNIRFEGAVEGFLLPGEKGLN